MSKATADTYSTIIFAVVSTVSLGLLGVFLPDVECETDPPFFLAGTAADCSATGVAATAASQDVSPPPTPVAGGDATATLSTRKQLFDHPGDAPAPVAAPLELAR